jgi:hypothetical protein
MRVATSSRSLRVYARIVFVICFAVLQALTVEGSRSQVIQIKPKASACDSSLVDAAMEVSSLKDMGKLMSAEVGPVFAQVEQALRAAAGACCPETATCCSG